MKITITVSEDDLERGGFALPQISEINRQRILEAIEIGLKIQLHEQIKKATTNFWWLPRNSDIKE